MCELLGMSSNVPADICFSFTGLMQRGGQTGPHKDGWGIAFYDGKGCRTFHDPHPSAHSEIAKFIKTLPIKSKQVICHIRKANRGRVCLENTHPFLRELWGRNWCFAHNGQLKGVKKLLKLQHYFPVGTTDSEHVFCWMMDQIFERFGKNPPRRKEVLWNFIESLCLKATEYGVFNMLLSDSKVLYVFCTTKLVWLTRKAPFGRAKLVDGDMEVDFGKHNHPHEVITVIATAPLTDNEDWFKAEKKEFLVFQDGHLKNKKE